MKLALCHYSYHRRWANEGWDIARLTRETQALGVDGIDYHTKLIGVSPDEAIGAIGSALAGASLELSGLSLSTNFNLEDSAEFDAHIAETVAWLETAAALNAPVCRIFGGKVDRSDKAAIAPALQRVTIAMKQLAPRAEALGLVLAIENHGGLPCTAEEQIDVIQQVNSPALRATVDIGNYISCGQRGEVGTALAAGYAAYVHVKDYTPSEGGPRSYTSCTLGKGELDIPQCLRSLKEAGFDDYVAIEYEGAEDETTGVVESVRYMKEMLAAL